MTTVTTTTEAQSAEDHRREKFSEYLDLEQTLNTKLLAEWEKVALPYQLGITNACNQGEWQKAYDIANSIDMTPVGEACVDLAYQIFQGAIAFGAQQVHPDPHIPTSNTTAPIDGVVSQFLKGIEYNATIAAQKAAIQSIKDAQAAAQITKSEVVVEKKQPLSDFVSFKEDGDRSLQMASALHTNRLSSWGFIAEADVRGVTTYQLVATIDDRTSDYCLMIDGTTFTVDSARDLVNRAVTATDPNDLRDIQPWPDQSQAGLTEIGEMSDDDLIAAGYNVPPFHPWCRTIMVTVDDDSQGPDTSVDTQGPNTSVDETDTTDDTNNPDLGRTEPQDSYISTQETFKDLGIDFTQEEVDKWNTVIGVNPATLGADLTGQSAIDLITTGGNLGIVVKDNDIDVNWSIDAGGGVKGDGGITFNNLVASINKLTIDKADSDDDLGSYMAGFFAGLSATARRAEAKYIDIQAEEDDAKPLILLGFAPDAVAWGNMREDLLQNITTGALNDSFSSLNDVQKQTVLALLDNSDPQALVTLAHLSLPEAFLDALLSLRFTAYLTFDDTVEAGLTAADLFG